MNESIPDKFTSIERTVVGEASLLLLSLKDAPMSVGRVYLAHRERLSTSTYDSFSAALTFLYGAGVINYENGLVSVA